MTSTTDSITDAPSSLFSLATLSHGLQEARCGKLGFAIVAVNTVAMAVFAGNLIWGSSLLGRVGGACAAVILPSMALFGPLNYFYYLPQPLRMGLGFAAAWASVTVHPNGAWEGKFADWAHFYDARLAHSLVNFCQDKGIKTVMDCGCGTGDYVKELRRSGMQHVYGCDGNPDTSQLGGENCIVADLSVPNFLSKTRHAGNKFGCVMSLEVAEHLPPQHEDVFLDNVTGIVAKDGWLILSWAKKGQGGLGHVNEQNEEYVLEKMEKRGWTLVKDEAQKLRLQTSPHTFWFRDTIYVFRRSN